MPNDTIRIERKKGATKKRAYKKSFLFYFFIHYTFTYPHSSSAYFTSIIYHTSKNVLPFVRSSVRPSASSAQKKKFYKYISYIKLRKQLMLFYSRKKYHFLNWKDKINRFRSFGRNCETDLFFFFLERCTYSSD